MEFYDLYINEFNLTLSDILKSNAESINNSDKIFEIAVKERKIEFYKLRENMFSQNVEPGTKYFLIEKFVCEYFMPQEIKIECFENAYLNAKRRMVESYKDHPFLKKVNNFMHLSNDNIIKKVGQYIAFYQPDEILFNELDIYNKQLIFTDLFNEINSKYICDTELVTFRFVMMNKELPKGKQKIHWKTIKTEGIAFAKHFNFTLKDLNNCFSHNKGVFKANNRSKIWPKKEFEELLNKYKN